MDRLFLEKALAPIKLCSRILVTFALSLFGLIMPAHGAELSASGPAVSELDLNFGLVGVSGDSVKLSGSLAAPLTYRFGLQVDGEAGIRQETFTGGLGVHLFARDPSAYMIGLYVSRHSMVGYHVDEAIWDSINVSRLGVEGKLYSGPLTFGGLVGIQRVRVPRMENAGYESSYSFAPVNENTPFAILDFSAYPTDNLRLTGELHFEPLKNSAGVGLDFNTEVGDVPTTIFVNGSLDSEGVNTVSAGVNFSLGGTRDNSLLRRNREGISRISSPSFPKLICTLVSSAVEPVICSGCSEGTAGSCQSSRTLACGDPNVVTGRCPRGMIPCTGVVFRKNEQQCYRDE